MSIYCEPDHWFIKELSDYLNQNPITKDQLIKEADLEPIDPWNKGKKGLQTPWNKGKKGAQKMSEESKEKLRQMNLGKKLSEEHKAKIGKSNAVSKKGGKLTEEHKKKLSISMKAYRNRIK